MGEILPIKNLKKNYNQDRNIGKIRFFEFSNAGSSSWQLTKLLNSSNKSSTDLKRVPVSFLTWDIVISMEKIISRWRSFPKF